MDRQRGGTPAGCPHNVPTEEAVDATLREADQVLRGLLPSELLERRAIQGRDTTVMEAVYHVVEHFAGHTGQVIWIAKMNAPGAVRFYEDGDGIATPLFLGEGEFEMGAGRTDA